VRGLLPPAKPLREDAGNDSADEDPDAACHHVSNSASTARLQCSGSCLPRLYQTAQAAQARRGYSDECQRERR
jgi:hypothetical protein